MYIYNKYAYALLSPRETARRILTKLTKMFHAFV